MYLQNSLKVWGFVWFLVWLVREAQGLILLLRYRVPFFEEININCAVAFIIGFNYTVFPVERFAQVERVFWWWGCVLHSDFIRQEGVHERAKAGHIGRWSG